MDKRFGLHDHLLSRPPPPAPPAPPPPPRAIYPERESILYPRVIVANGLDPCSDPSTDLEHMLNCGHLIHTLQPSEPCAPNCYYVYFRMRQMAMTVSEEHLFCDACAEERFETLIPGGLTSEQAEEHRVQQRQDAGVQYSKTTYYRPCFIALKNTRVKCHRDGRLSTLYTPRQQHHPFDTALPQIGDNMFEGIDPNPPREVDVMAEGREKTQPSFRDDDPRPTGHEDAVAKGKKKLKVSFEEESEQTREDDEASGSNRGAPNATRTTVPHKTATPKPRRQKASLRAKSTTVPDKAATPNPRRQKVSLRAKSTNAPDGAATPSPPRQKASLWAKITPVAPTGPTVPSQSPSDNDKENDGPTTPSARTQHDGTHTSTLSLDEQGHDRTVTSARGERRQSSDNNGDEDGEDDEEDQPVQPAKRKKAVPVARKSTRQKGKKKV